MKKGIIAGIIVLLAAAIVFCGVMVIRTGGRLDEESKQYADESVAAIVSRWNTEDLENRASPASRANLNHARIQSWFRIYRKLGKMKSYHGSQGQATTSMVAGRGTLVSAQYTATADFEAGPAEINIALIKSGHGWGISAFRISSDVFLKYAR